jgi:lipopolysaccharide transport system ATP-binding protein
LLQQLRVLREDGRPLNGELPLGGAVKFELHFRFEDPAQRIGAGVAFDNLFGQRLLTVHTCFDPNFALPNAIEGEQVFVCEIPSFPLMPGEYKVKVAIDLGESTADEVEDAMRLTVSGSDFYGTGRVPWNGLVVASHRWRLK